MKKRIRDAFFFLLEPVKARSVFWGIRHFPCPPPLLSSLLCVSIENELSLVFSSLSRGIGISLRVRVSCVGFLLSRFPFYFCVHLLGVSLCVALLPCRHRACVCVSHFSAALYSCFLTPSVPTHPRTMRPLLTLLESFSSLPLPPLSLSFAAQWVRVIGPEAFRFFLLLYLEPSA